jgi:hypothetical protein
VISSAEDVATPWILTKLVGCELKVVSLTWKVLHLNHESWDPESMNYIV